MHPDKAASEDASQQHKNFVRENKAVLSRMTALVWEESLRMEEAIRCLLDSFHHIGKEQKTGVLNSLLEREQQGGTFVGEDVAIPHVRVNHLPQPLIAIGVGKKGVQSLDSGRKAKIIILLLSPIDLPEKHIETLGIISRMAADDLLRKSMLAANESRSVRGMIQDWAVKMENMGDRGKLTGP
nr:PTS sugar transporter subunit IIA [Desulfobacula sp.]